MTFKNGLRYSKWCVRKKTEVIMSVRSSSVYWRPTIFSWISLRWLFGIPLCHIVLLGLLLFHLKSLVFVAIWLLPPWFWFCFSLFLYISKLLNNVLDPSKKIFKFGVIYDSISSVVVFFPSTSLYCHLNVTFLTDRGSVCGFSPSSWTRKWWLSFKTTFDFNASLFKWWLKISQQKLWEVFGWK